MNSLTLYELKKEIIQSSLNTLKSQVATIEFITNRLLPELEGKPDTLLNKTDYDDFKVLDYFYDSGLKDSLGTIIGTFKVKVEPEPK